MDRMKPKSALNCLVVLTLMSGLSASAGMAYPDPPGGWTYIYHGDQLIVGPEDPCGAGNNNTEPLYSVCPAAWNSLDGQWSHQNESDEWDGSVIGGTLTTNSGGWGNNSPGGAMLNTQNGVSYLRMQSPGDPRDWGYIPDTSNRKVFFTHDISSDVGATKAQTILRSGVTLTFRARIPTLAKAGPPLDPLYPDKSSGYTGTDILPYPAGGDGYVTSDGGVGNFVVRETGNGADVPAASIAFSLTQTNDTLTGAANPVAGFAGLSFNEFNGNTPSGNVNFGQGTGTNLVAFDPTEWHEVYIVIRDDPADIGSHEAFIFLDGSLYPTVFKITGGNPAFNSSFISMGGSSTKQSFALDVDFYGYKDEQVFPPGALLPPSLFGFVPKNGAVFYPVANNFSFSASALMPTNTLPASGFKLILNGQDVSAQLALTGNDSSPSRTATFGALQPNTAYTSTIVVTDSSGLSTTNQFLFDTFVESEAFVIEAEDYNYLSGQFLPDRPVGGYFASQGTPGIDFYDTSMDSVINGYRYDAVDIGVAADTARAKFSSHTDYQITTIGPGEWWNYTTTLTNSSSRLFVRYASSSAASQYLRVDRVTSDPSQPTQTNELVGVIKVPRTGALSQFGYGELTDIQGRPVTLPFSGQTTLRLTTANANNNLAINFFFLIPAGAPSTNATVTASPGPNDTGVMGDAKVEVAIYDGTTPVNTATVMLRLNGMQVAATATKIGGVTSVKYTPGKPWTPGATYALNLTFNDGTERSLDWSFTVYDYPVLTPAMRVTNVISPGFVWRVYQNQENTDLGIAEAEQAIAGHSSLPNLADPNALGPASTSGIPASPGNAPMAFSLPTVINMSALASYWGNFNSDDYMPGIPGTSAGSDGISVEIKCFVELASGFHRLGVYSDDGFQTTAGFLNNAPLTLGSVGSASHQDNSYAFYVQESGVYAIRTIYYNRTGDAYIEWFMLKADGTRVLLNDTSNGGLRTYQQGTIPVMPPATLSVRLSDSRKVLLEWAAGILQSADNIKGTFENVADATSPYEVNQADAQQKFYRVKVQ